MSNSNHTVSIKRKLTLFVASAMLATSASLPASATVSNSNGQHLIGEQQSTLLLAGKGKGKAVEEEPSKGDKNPQKGEPSKGDKNPQKGEPSKGDKNPQKGEPSKGDKNPQKGEPSKGQENPKKDEPIKGGHSTEKTPSKQEKHQKGEARRQEDQNVNPAFKDYKKNGGKLSKDAWKKQGMPKK